MRAIDVEDLEAELGDMARQFESASLEEPLRESVLPIIREGFAENFTAAVGSEGGAWPARKPPRYGKDDGHPLLQDTLALFEATQGGAGGVAEVAGRDLSVGVDTGVKQGGIPGAAVHNFGYGPIPQREFLYASDDTLDRASAALAEGAFTVLFASP